MRKRLLFVGIAALTIAGRWAWLQERRFQRELAIWDSSDLVLPYYAPAQDSRPERDIPWEAILGAVALAGGATGFVLNGFNQVDGRIDAINAKLQELEAQDKLAQHERESSMILLQKDYLLLQKALEELQEESDRHDRRLYRAVENLTEALKARGLFVPRSETADQRAWPTDDPPTGVSRYHRPPTPPPGEPEL